MWEGGVNEPSFVYAPGRLAPATVDTPIHVIDVLPTLLGFARGPVPKNVDGVDARALWRSEPSRDRVLVLSFDNVQRCGAVLYGHYKYVLNGACGNAFADYSGWDGDDYTDDLGPCVGPTAECLFDLKADPKEQRDVKAAHPSLLDTLRSALLAADASAVPSRVLTTPGDSRAAPDLHGGSWVSWLSTNAP